MGEDVVTVTVSGPVGSGKSMVLTEVEAALQVAGADVNWVNADRERDLMSPATLAARGLAPPRVVLREHSSGAAGYWDSWYAGLASDLRRRLSVHDFKRLGEAFKAAFLIHWSDQGNGPHADLVAQLLALEAKPDLSSDAGILVGLLRRAADALSEPRADGSVTIMPRQRPTDCPRGPSCCGDIIPFAGGGYGTSCGLVGCKHNHNPTHGGCGTDRVL